MKTKLLTLFTVIFTTLSFSQTTFTVDGLDYEVISTNPNEVKITGGTPATTDLVIPATVIDNAITFSIIAIVEDAFRDSNLTSVIIPNGITSIEANAFRNNNLTDLVLPNSVTSIGNNSFRDNDISQLTLSTNLTDIPSGAFVGNQLTTVTIPNTIETIGSTAFSGNQLTTLTLPNSVVSVGAFAFFGNNISTLTLSNNLTTIERSIFSGNNLTSINIPNSVTSIREEAFRNNQLETLVIPDTVTTIERSAFRDNNLTSLSIGSGITELESNVFENNQLTTITIPTSVTTIGTQAFFNNQLETLVIPDTVTSLGGLAFRNNNLTSLSIGSGITELNSSVFRDNQLTTVTIPSAVTNLRFDVFQGNPLTSVIVEATTPPSIITGNNDSFGNRSNIDLTVPNGTEAAYADAEWTGFKSVNGVVPFGVGGTFAVNGLDYTVTSLTPNEVEASGGTTIPTNLIIPETVTIQGELFSITGIGTSAFEAKQLTSVSLPNGLITIGVSAFKNNLITSVSFPESLITISSQAFRANQLSEVTIPAAVTSIGSFAFTGGNPVVTIIVEGNLPPSISSNSNSNTFANRSGIDLFIPTDTTQAYTDATWTGFKSVTEANKALVLKVYLQGASLNPNTGEENLMRDDLRVAGFIPSTSPYADGITIASDGAPAANINDDCVDWIFVELRDVNDSSIVIEGKSGFIQRDGDIVSSDGFSPFEFTSQPDDYFVAIKHRNHLGIMVENAKRLSSVATVLNFTNADSPITNGTNAQTNIGMPTGIVGMWAGDANADSIVRFSGTNAEPTDIRDAVLNDPGNFFNSTQFAPQDYFNGDINMDGELKFSGANSEPLFIRDNILGNPGNVFNSLLSSIFAQLLENSAAILRQKTMIEAQLKAQNKF